MLRARVASLEKAAQATDSTECQCPTVPGVSGWRFVTEYEAPENQTPEELERARARSDLVERCQRCGKARNVVAFVDTDDWRSATRGTVEDPADPLAG